MRNNPVIGVAITAALSLPFTMAKADDFFHNVNEGTDAVKVHSSIDTNVAATNMPAIATGGTVSTYFKKAEDTNATSTDSIISVEPDSGITYARELFSSDSPDQLPSSGKAGVVYQIDGKITKNFDLTFSLTEGSITGNQLLLAISGATYPKITGGSPSGGSVTYQVEAADSTASALENGSQFLFLYQISNADGLGQPGGKIEMTAELKTSLTNIVVNPKRTETVAVSKPSTTIVLVDEPQGKVNVSVADDSKLFSGDPISNGDEGGYISAKRARIGYISIASDSDAMESDGTTSFQIGEGTDGKLADAEDDGFVLEITGGQFAASGLTNASKGRVYIDVAGLSDAEVTDENTATFRLSSSEVATLRQQTGDHTDSNQASIVIEVDEETQINSIENPPEANLQLTFHDDSTISDDGGILASLNLPVELRQIKKDGVVCWIYNVPHSAAPDVGNIRITNDSSTTDTITAKMFDTNGAAIGPAEGAILNGGNAIEAGQTIRITASDLETAGFPQWTGRAIMQLTTALPNVEVLNLLRNTAPGSPLTNLSVGATGQSCESL